jgi:TetR/AcrR family transcriptional regulator, cholesterol catabolism regulator
LEPCAPAWRRCRGYRTLSDVVAPDERRNRIVDVAIRLARARGFESVGLREVAEEAGVALGTLYKSFRSKDEIVSAAVEHQTRNLRRRFVERPAQGATALERIEDLFTRLTRALVRRPAYARIVLSSVPANQAVIASSLVKYELEMKRLVIAAIRGASPRDVEESSYGETEETIAFLLRQIWFSGLIGWAGNLSSPPEVIRHVTTAARLLLAGAAAERELPDLA